MILKSIKISNYKSLGENQNVLLIEPNVTTLIGKNESGKSNILEVLGKVSFINGAPSEVFDALNRKYQQGKVAIYLDLSFTCEETKELGIKNKETRFILDEPNKVKIEGAVSEYFQQQKILNLVSNLKEVYDKNLNKLNSNDRATFNAYLTAFNQLNSNICANYEAFIKTIMIWRMNIDDENKINEIENTCHELSESIKFVYDKFPILHYYHEAKLENYYLINDEFIKKYDKSNNPFNQLLSACKVELSEIQKAFSNNAGVSQDAREIIQEKIKENLEEKFSKFYTQEKVRITSRFNNNCFSIMVKTSSINMQISERSNGLQWYFNLFIDILGHNFENKNIIYLVDEPGVYLHVQAQKELLDLFKELTKGKNQLIYTTHSPYMLDVENLVQIRALEKVNGDTYIYNSVYSISQENTSKLETLSPLLEVIGLDLKYNIGPSMTKINLVVEGITDYMYLNAMMKYMNIDNFYIIPSIGVGNIDKIVSILFGWGCSFKIILDCDNAGNGQAQKLERGFGLILNKDYFYINGVSQYYKDNSATIEDLISIEDNKKLQFKYDKTKSEATKKLAARNFFDMVREGILIPSKETVESFNKLFNQIQNSFNCI